MKIITISREFGSGGRELGKRLSDQLGWDYYDSEIIAAVAKNSGLDPAYLEQTLSDHGWRNFPLTFRGTLGSAAYIQSSGVELLLEQRRVIRQIAALGKDCILVGRNADVILEEYHPFKLFVCADTGAKVRRCRQRAPQGEDLTEKELIRKMKRIDRMRAQTRELISGSGWGEREWYHLTLNTSEWELPALAPAVAAFALSWFGRKE